MTAAQFATQFKFLTKTEAAAKAIGDAVAQVLDRHDWDVRGIGADVVRALDVKGIGVYAV